MPSLHTIIVLLAWWHSRSLPSWCRVLAGVWLIGTLLATLGFGFHYLVDLVVAVPYALAIQAFCVPCLAWRAPIRLAALALGAGLVAGWLVVLRFHLDWLMPTPALPISAAILTVAASFAVERLLSQAASIRADVWSGFDHA
jgi:hypothetical protein